MERLRKVADMEKLIEALHVIQEECDKHYDHCGTCPMYSEDGHCCSVTDLKPTNWKINDNVKVML